MKTWFPLVASMLCVNVALAEPPEAPANEVQKSASALVQKQIVDPLTKIGAKRSRFSRAAPVPVQRRVRVLDTTAQSDANGKHFVRFAIDARRAYEGEEERMAWNKDALLGCAYVDSGEVFVQRGDTFMPAKTVLGANDKAQPVVCRAVPKEAA